MTRFARINAFPGIPLVPRRAFVQSADPDDLRRRVNEAIVALNLRIQSFGPPPIFVALNLAGAGDGHTFVVEIIEAPPPILTPVGGLGLLFAITPRVVCYMASSREELPVQRAAALARAGLAIATLEDEQVAGSEQGQRFMGMILGTYTAV